MKVIINKKVLENRIGIIKKMIDNKSKVPGMKGVKVISKDNKLILIANNTKCRNFYRTIKITLDAEIIEDGEILIDSKIFESCIKNCDGDFIDIESIKDDVFINSNNFRSKNKLIDIEEFINIMPEDNMEKVSMVNSHDFIKMINKVIPAISKDLTKPVLNCFYMELLKDNYISLTSIDGYRCATGKIFSQNNTINDYIIPADTMKIISNVKSKCDIEIFANDEYIKFATNDIDIYSQLYAGEFIRYNKLFTKNNNTKVIVNTKELKNSLKGFKDICKSERNKLIKLYIEDGKIKINDSKNTSYRELVADIQGDNLKIEFNLQYLIEGIKSIKDNEITLEFTSNVDPLTITSLNYRYLLLPVRVVNM